MSSVETGQMSAVETGQMSAAETGQISSVAGTDIHLVSNHKVDGTKVSIAPRPQCSSLRDLNCGISDFSIMAIPQCSSRR